MIASLRDQLMDEIDLLNESQAASLLAFIKSLRVSNDSVTYDSSNDPVLTGEWTFGASPNLAEQSGEILRQEFGVSRKSGYEP